MDRVMKTQSNKLKIQKIQLLLTYKFFRFGSNVYIKKVVFPQAYSINERSTRTLTLSIFEMGFVLIFVTTLLDDVIP